MKKVLVALIVVAMLVCYVPTAFAADDLYTVRMVYWPGPESDAMDVVLNYWNENKAQEAGFYVEQELFGRDNIMLKEEALMAAKSSDVDLFFTASRWLGKYWMHMEPLQQYLDNPEINIYGADTEGRIPATVDGFRWLDGTLYGVPMDLSNHFLYYRSDLIDELLSNADWQASYKKIALEQLGKELEPKDPADWTWDDYLAASFFFTKAYNPDSPTEYGNFTHGKVMGPTAFLWTNCYWSFGGDWFDADGNVAFDNDAARQALAVWKTSFEKGLTPESSVNGEFAEDNEAMIAGQCAMTVHWNAGYATINAEESPVHGKIKVCAPPAGPEGHFAYNHTLGVGISKYSEHKEEAARWAAWLYTDEAAKLYAEAGGIAPSKAVLADMSDQFPVYGYMVDVLNACGKNLPPTAGIIEDMACGLLADAWNGVIDFDTALAQLQAEATEEMSYWQ